jgi:hypothetical protein
VLQIVSDKFDNILLVKMTSFVIGNNGLLFVSAIYIYIGATAAKIVNIFKDKDSTLHHSELYLLLVGGIAITIILCVLIHITRKEMNKYMD